jgi:hypothetical protein
VSRHSRELIAEKIEVERLFNYLIANEGVSLEQIRTDLDISKKRFDFFMGCCRAACLATGNKPWFVNNDIGKMDPMARKLKITQW